MAIYTKHLLGGAATWLLSMPLAAAYVAPVNVSPPYVPPPVYAVSSSAPPAYAPTYVAPPVYASPTYVAPPVYESPTYAAPPVYASPTYAAPPVYVASPTYAPPVYVSPTYAPPPYASPTPVAPVYAPKCPSTYGGYSNLTAQPPNHFKLVVSSSTTKQGYLYLTSGGRLHEDVSTAATFVLSNDQLGKVVAATDPQGTSFFVGAEHISDASTTLGLLPICTSQSIIKKFELVSCDLVPLGDQCVQHYLKWSDESFTAGSGAAVFGVDGVCGGADPVDGNDVIARLTAPAGVCSTGVKLYALAA